MTLLRAPTAHQRVLVSATIGVLVGFSLAWFAPWQVAWLVGWDAAAAVMVDLGVGLRARLRRRGTRAWATREDNSRTSAQFILVTASVVSLVGVGLDLAEARRLDQPAHALATGVALAAVALSWGVVHTVYALRYAHEYYTDPVGGIDFKTDVAPDYLDFAYVAFTVGMTFQVSDTDIQSRIVRRTVLRHALLAYLFGAVILAVMINVVAGLFQ